MNKIIRSALSCSNIPRTDSDTSLATEPKCTVGDLDNNPQHIFADEVHLYILPRVFENMHQDNGLNKLEIGMEIDEEAISNEIDGYFGQFNGRMIKLSESELSSVLQKILLRNVKYIVNGSSNAMHNNLIKEIASVIVDNSVSRFNIVQTCILDINNKCGKSEDVQTYIDLSKKLLINPNLLSQMDHTLLKVNNWYNYVLSHKDINQHYYLTYAAQLINEKLFTSSMMSSALDDINKVFANNLSVTTQLAVAEIDLFESRADGMTHLDYALALLMKYRWEIANYYEENGIKMKEFVLSEYEEQLLRRLYIDRKLVCKVFKSIREVTKDSEKYVDCDSIISNSLFRDSSVPEIKDPSSFKYRDESIDARLDKALENHADSPFTARNYIVNRVDLYKNLVSGHKKQENSIKGIQKVINSVLSVSGKKVVVGSFLGTILFTTTRFCSKIPLQNWSKNSTINGGPQTGSGMERSNSFVYESMKENPSSRH
ncbi:hypothetical protein NEPAR06_2133 [Nematocida parisii]|nr:hypothetical protein NEPAR07_2189 [Nematocida parisii]KAI5156095.1 hypothetical protein NEPAR06_2133 [Nematocida parisii]